MAEWPLIGRHEELAFLRTAVRERGGAVLSGRSGVGKTRLARETAASLDDWYVARTTVTPAVGTLPFGGLAGLNLIDAAAALSGPGLLSRLAATLVERADGRPALVVVDDAHLLDDLSAAFLHHLVSSGAAAVLVTVRTGQPPPAEVLSLSKDGLVPRLELQPLGPVEFAALVTASFGGEADHQTQQRLWTVTGGNVLYLHELLADAEETGALTERHGAWTWTRVAAAGPRLGEIVAERMGRPEGPRRELVELLAVGEPLSVGLLEQLVPEVDLAEEERRGLIVVDETGRRADVRLAHPLFAEVVGARLPILARRRIQRELADALEAAGRRRQEDLLRLAVWRVESSSADDARLLLDAATSARRVLDPALAERLARASLEIDPTFDAGLVLGGSLGDLGRLGEATQVLEALTGREPDVRARQLLARERAWIEFRGPGGLAAGEALLADVEAAGGDPRLRLMARAELALLLTYAGRTDDALAIGEKMLVDESVDEPVRLRALPAVGPCLLLAGRVDEVTALCDGLERAAERCRVELPQGKGWVWQLRSSALMASGRLREAASLLLPSIERTDAPALTAGEQAFASAKAGRVLLLQGRPRSALRQLGAAAASLAVADPAGCRMWCLSLIAQAWAQLGDGAEAARFAAQAVAEQANGFALWEQDAAGARAWAAAAAGERSRATRELVAAADASAAKGQRLWELMALHDALRLGASEVASRLESVAAGVDGPYARAVAAHAAAVRAMDPSGLEATAGRFSELGYELIAAEASGLAARWWGANGHPERAAAAERAYRAHLAHCETEKAPSLPQRGSGAGLTRREREVADLAVRGLSNNEIAERLVLSVRTVESHLYSAYAKLGIADRSELPDVLAPGSA